MMQSLSRLGPRMAALLASLLTLFSFGSPALADQVTWVPEAATSVAPDTLFRPDLSSEPAVAASGGMITGNSTDTSAGLTSQVDWGQGRFGPSVHIRPGGTASCVRWISDGLMPSDEFTVNFWEKRDSPAWPISSPLLSINGNNTLEFLSYRGMLYVHAYVPSLGVNKAYMAAPVGLTDTLWHQVSATFKAGVLTVYTDGIRRGAVSGVSFLPAWTCGIHGNGICLCGSAGHPGDFTLSDVEIDRTCRVPGLAVTLRSLDGSMAVDALLTTSQTPPLVASLHPGSGGVNAPPSPVQAQSALSLMRTDKLINATPIKAGAPDASHPSQGHSGQFSYDWEVVDRTFDYLRSHGVLPYISVDSTPQILGGPAPFSGSQLATALSSVATFGVLPPNSLTSWAAIVSDFAWHILKDRAETVPYWSVWNEPSIMFRGTAVQYDALYDATAQALRSVDPTANIGGPEDFTTNGSAYLPQLFQHCQSSGSPLNFLSYHDYTGDLSDLDRSRRMLDAATGQPGFPAVIGETNWSSEALPSGLYQWRSGDWHLRAFDASYLTSYLIRATQIGGFPLITFSATQYGDPLDLSDSWHEMQLLGPRGEQWAPYNALVSWKQTMGSQVLSAVSDLPPGVYGLATTDPSMGTFGVALSNFGYSQRQSRTVHLTLQHVTGSYSVQESLLDALHSRFDAEGEGPDTASIDSLLPSWSANVQADGTGSIRVDVTLPSCSCAFLKFTPGTLPALVAYVDRAGQFDPVAPVAKQSFTRAPWRGWMDTVPATTLLNGMGVVYNLPASANQDGVCQVLSDCGIHSARIEMGWGGVDWAEDALSNPVNLRYYREVLLACKAHGIRPLILLNAHHGQPCPYMRQQVVVSSGGAAGATTLILQSVAGMTPGQSGLTGLPGETVNKMAAILFTAINPADNAVTLSCPLPSAIPEGQSVTVDTLKYPPLFPVGTPLFEQTVGGWLRYVQLVCSFVQSQGISDFQIEIWNELGFGSDFIRNLGYYSPSLPALARQLDTLRPGGSCWEMARRTASLVKSTAPGCRVFWGFSNVSAYHTPIAQLPAGIDGQSYHFYGTGRFTVGQHDFPPAARASWFIDPVPPAGFAVALPEGIASGSIDTEGYYHLLATWLRPQGFEQIFSEHGYLPSGLGLTGPAALGYKTKALLRGYLFPIGKGLGQVDVYAAYAQGDENAGVLPGGVDPATYASFTDQEMSPPLIALRNVTRKLSGAAPGPVTPLDLSFAALGPARIVAPGIDMRDRLVFLPFQVRPGRYVCGVYVMSWDASQAFDPISYVLCVKNVPPGSVVDYYDPVEGKDLAARVLDRSAQSVTVQVSAVDYPRLLTIQG